MLHKSKHKSPATRSVAGSAALPDNAGAALRASSFKEAIEGYKELLKRERRPEWLAGLAAAYAGRAAQLAAKGLVKEASALWRTRAEVCGTPVFEGPYVGWLLQTGEVQQALRLLTGTAKQPPEIQAQLETQLAGIVLVAPDGALTGLPVDSPLLRHRAAAQAALAAYARGDDAAMTGHLQAIPFRSPFRDLRAILKALALHATDAEQAALALAKVPAHGPFEPLAAALRVCLLPGQEWVTALPGLDEGGRTLVLDIKGCPEERRALVLELAKQSDAQVPAAVLYDLLLRNRRVLGEATASRLCRRLLPHVPERLKPFGASFGMPTADETERILALAAELKQRTDQAEDHWLRLVQRLKADPAGHQRAAQVFRHLADDLHHCAQDGNPCDDVLDWWGQCIELDPEDRATHLKLIRTRRSHSKLREARSSLEVALVRFPKDVEVLLEAVEIALASGAFKKAAGIAKQILELDPINPRVRAIVGRAHLSHARKQIEGRHPVAARRELDEAARWLRSVADRALIKLLDGLIDEHAAQSDVQLREALGELGGSLVGSFHLLLEAGRTRRDPKVLLLRAGVDLNTTPADKEIVAFAHALNAAGDADNSLHTALGPLRAMLGRAAAMQLTEPDLLLVCEALHRRNERDLVRRYADRALQRWPGRPVFVYLKAAAAYGANPWQIPQRELSALEKALDEARSQGDQRTALRLRELLSAEEGEFGPPVGFEGDDVDELAGADPRAVLEMMLAFGGEDRFLDLTRQQLGKDAFEALRREIGGNKKRFVRALVDLLASAPLLPGLGANPAPPPRRGRRRPPPEQQKDLFGD